MEMAKYRINGTACERQELEALISKAQHSSENCYTSPNNSTGNGECKRNEEVVA
jgi:hypothetical protein